MTASARNARRQLGGPMCLFVHGPGGFLSVVFSGKKSPKVISQYPYENPSGAMHKMGTLFLPRRQEDFGLMMARIEENQGLVTVILRRI